jgi:heme/copper-type cytochrome/quinol oxidase subunit 4
MVHIFVYHSVHPTLGEAIMKAQDIALLTLSGFALWLIGTLYYAWRATAIFESTSQRYWISFFLSPILTAVICIAILKARQIPPTAWASAVLLLAIPGMIGETIILSHLPTFMPRLQATSAGRYGAFLFAAYALVLGIAEVITLRATS